jgi:hypothetical protein
MRYKYNTNWSKGQDEIERIRFLSIPKDKFGWTWFSNPLKTHVLLIPDTSLVVRIMYLHAQAREQVWDMASGVFFVALWP